MNGTQIIFPWDTAQDHNAKREMTLADYVGFLDSHVRMHVTVNGKAIGSFAVKDEGNELEATTRLPDGRILVFEMMPGAPRSRDPIATSQELVTYVIARFNRGEL